MGRALRLKRTIIDKLLVCGQPPQAETDGRPRLADHEHSSVVTVPGPPPLSTESSMKTIHYGMGSFPPYRLNHLLRRDTLTSGSALSRVSGSTFFSTVRGAVRAHVFFEVGP